MTQLTTLFTAGAEQRAASPIIYVSVAFQTRMPHPLVGGSGRLWDLGLWPVHHQTTSPQHDVDKYRHLRLLQKGVALQTELDPDAWSLQTSAKPGPHPLVGVLGLVMAVAAPEDLAAAGRDHPAAPPVVRAAVLAAAALAQLRQLVWCGRRQQPRKHPAPCPKRRISQRTSIPQRTPAVLAGVLPRALAAGARARARGAPAWHGSA